MSYIGNPPVNGVFRKLDTIAASFNGSTTSFNLTSGGAAVSPGLTTNLIISLGGIIQEPNTAYTVNGSVISFTEAPKAGVSFWGIQLGDVGLASTPNQAAMTTQVFTATAGQTTFTVAGGYTAGQIQVLRNGVQLVVGVDVTATNGTTFVLTNAATAGDTLVAVIYTSFIVANAVAKSGDTMSGTLVAPAVNTTTLTVNSVPVLAGPAFFAYATVNQTISNTTYTKVNLSAEIYDTNNNFDTSTARFTPTVAGYYQISSRVGMLGIANMTDCFGSLYKNGSEFARMGQATTGATASFPCPAGSVLVYMNGSTDYLELYIYQGNAAASSLQTNAFGAASTYMTGVFVRS